MLASRTTRDHLSTSPRMNAANSSGVLGEASMVASARRAFISGVESVLISVACSLARIGLGTDDCAHTPYQTVTSKPGKPASATVGTSGNSGLRVSVLTASPRVLPPL